MKTSAKNTTWKRFGLPTRLLSVLCLITLFAAACDDEEGGTLNEVADGSDSSGTSGDVTTTDTSGTTRPDTSGTTTQGDTDDDTSGGDTSGNDTSGGDTSGNDTSGADTSGGDTSGSDVISAECGNGILEAGEACDTDDLASETCLTLAFDGGDLACADDCTFDTSACTGSGPVCGDDVAEGLEPCDGTDTPTCTELGFDSGDTLCNDDCTLDETACETCGDGEITGDELCDGVELNGADCAGLGFDGGDLACDATTCAFDTSACTTNAVCGNSVVESPETCDDGNTDTEACDYGDTSCTVCDATCQNAAGATSFCGDSATDAANEDCDDGNAATEACDYGDTSCTVCDATCQNAAGATSFCGDSATDAANEDCDDGNAATEECAYGQASCTVCDATCQDAAGETDVCGDGTVDSGDEACDDNNTATEVCAYGDTSCTVCDSACDLVAGVTSFCGDALVDVANGEACDTTLDASVTCISLGQDGGTAACTACAVDTTGCFDTNDRCDDAIAITTPGTVTGTNFVGTDNYGVYAGCPGVSGSTTGVGVRDVVYEVTLDPGEVFSATLSLLDGQDGALALVSDCAAISGTTCADFSDTTSATERVDYTNATSSPQTLFLIVDGYSGTAPPDEGDFSLVTTFRIPACGDGVLDAPAEQCDDGNNDPLDGCDATCQREIPANDTCTTPTALVAGSNGPFSNAAATPDYSGYSACPGFASSAVGPDTAYSITIPPRTTLSVTMDVPAAAPTIDPVLVITTDCATISAATCLADADGGGGGIDETATFTNASSQPINVFVIADTYSATAITGDFTLNTTLTPLPSCTDDTFDGGAGNDSQATATPITSGFNDTNLVMCGAFVPPANAGAERDWYAITAAAGDQINASLAFTHANGNLDLFLLNSAGTVLASSTGTTSAESVSFTVAVAGTYFLRVDPGSPTDTDARNTYTLSANISGPPAFTCPTDDPLEQNDSQAAARPITIGTPFDAIRCGSDDDVYSVALTAGDILDVSIAFNQATASNNLDLEVFNSAGLILMRRSLSATGATSERITIGAQATGTYFLRVYGSTTTSANSGVNSAVYTLTSRLLPATTDRIVGCTAPICVASPGTRGGGTIYTYDIPKASFPISNTVSQTGNLTGETSWRHSNDGPREVIVELPTTGFTQYASTTCFPTNAGDTFLGVFFSNPRLAPNIPGAASDDAPEGACSEVTETAAGTPPGLSIIPATPGSATMFVVVEEYFGTTAGYWSPTATATSRTFSIELVP